MELRFWIDPETGLPHIFDYRVTEQEEMTKRRKQAYPAGWNEDRIRKLAEHYDNQAEDEQVAEHEAAFLAEGQTVMVVPTELVPAIVKLISEKRPA